MNKEKKKKDKIFLFLAKTVIKKKKSNWWLGFEHQSTTAFLSQSLYHGRNMVGVKMA